MLIKNSFFVLIIFWIVIFFQITGFKFIWDIELISRLANLIALVLLTIYSFYALASGLYEKKVWIYYILPSLMVMAGMLLNVSINVISNYQLFSYYGLILPWAAYLIIPKLMKQRKINSKKLWMYYYYFMLLANVFGVIDYILMFYGLPYFHMIETPYGIFLSGKFSILHMLEDGTAHYRYYACFMEPGTLAMYLLPALAYSFLNKKHIGTCIFLIAFFLTDSLGGIISLILLSIILIFISFRNKKNMIFLGLFVSILCACLIWISYGDSLKQSYEDKNGSRTVREENFINTFIRLPILVVKYPLGFELAESTEKMQNNKDYLGSNFTPANALQTGGVISFVGYMLCLLITTIISIVNLMNNSLTKESKVVFSSLIVLLPFIFQRAVIWDSALFAFLYAPSIIKALHSKQNVELMEIV